jgi:hypothetical protein
MQGANRLALSLILLASTLTSGQASPPPSTQNNPGKAGETMAAAGQTGDRIRPPSRLTYPRLYCTPDGNSHWENVSVELRKTDFAPPAPPIHIGEKAPASSTFFGGFEAGWGVRDLETGVYHPAPAAQFIVVLDGVFSITASDGEARQFRPGEVFRVEDTPPCKGHITVVGDKTGFFLFAR